MTLREARAILGRVSLSDCVIDNTGEIPTIIGFQPSFPILFDTFLKAWRRYEQFGGKYIYFKHFRRLHKPVTGLTISIR